MNILRRVVVAHRFIAPTQRTKSSPCCDFVAIRKSSTAVSHSAPYPSRTHTCGHLRAGNVGERVTLTGWLRSSRLISPRISFFSLKDSHGVTQLLVKHTPSDPTRGNLDQLSNTPLDSTILVQGKVSRRPEKDRDNKELTGDIEVLVDSCIILNAALPQMPFPTSFPVDVKEEIRAKYRYLDLRRNSLAENIRKRSRVAHSIRQQLVEQDFVEVETPLLLKSSPEGAREFLVPTRTPSPTSPPLFYALSQSPQQPKQLIISSGAIDKYFQFAKCFRDEDGRKDRQPEFTQIDLEMAFVSWGLTPEQAKISGGWRIGGSEVRDVAEGLVKKVWKDFEGVELTEQFPVMTYQEAMGKYGSDKPDTRFGLHISDVTQHIPPNVIKENIAVDCFVLRPSRDSLISAAESGVSQADIETGVQRIAITADNLSSWLSEACKASDVATSETVPVDGVNTALDICAGDVVWLAPRKSRLEGGSTTLGRVRLRLAEATAAKGFDVYSSKPHFLWVTEFPLFTKADDDKDFLAHGRWSSSHHPFTAPMWEDIPALYGGRVEEVRGQHYDLVLNGMEIGGGSVRVHDAAMQEYIMRKILQLSDVECSTFEHLLQALKFGAPPHGGIALGFDRLMSILCNTKSIRDVIAFPKTTGGTDAMFKSPGVVDPALLKQYGLTSN